MSGPCDIGHDHVVASGTCTACGLPVLLAGPLPPTGDTPAWLAPPFADPDTAATCRATGDFHTIDVARGTCCGCSACLHAIGVPNGSTVWVEEPRVTEVEEGVRRPQDAETSTEGTEGPPKADRRADGKTPKSLEKGGGSVYRLQGVNSRDIVRADGRFVAGEAAERFWSRVSEDRDGCWIWHGHRNADGYGQFKVTVAAGRYRTVRAHRWAYETARGPIPAGLTLDHLCERPACVRPDHLEPVTNAENVRRRHARQRATREGTTR